MTTTVARNTNRAAAKARTAKAAQRTPLPGDLPTTTVALRQVAKELGLKGLGSANKATLLPAITAEMERRAPAPAKKAPKMCVVCGKRRPTAKNGPGFNDQCDPCHEEGGGWENTHSDGGHAEILAVEEADRTTELPVALTDGGRHRARTGTSTPTRAGVTSDVAHTGRSSKLTTRVQGHAVHAQPQVTVVDGGLFSRHFACPLTKRRQKA